MKRTRPLLLLAAALLLGAPASIRAAELADGYAAALRDCLTQISQKHPELAAQSLDLYLDEALDARHSGQVAVTLQGPKGTAYIGRCHIERGALVRSDELARPRS